MKKTWLLALAGLTLVIAACGDADNDDSEVATLETTTTVAAQAPETTTTTIDQEAAALDLTQCLRDQGLELEDPTVDANGNVQIGDFIGEPPDLTDEEIQGLLDACEEFIEGFTQGFEIPDLTELEDTVLEFAQCMRDNGFDLPDPDFSGGLLGGGQDGGPPAGPFGDLEIDPNDPDFIAAFEVCQPILAQLGFPGGPGGPGGG